MSTVVFNPIELPPRLHLYGFTIVPTLLRPKSRGSVTLVSADPREPPNVDLNYFADGRDVKVLAEGIKTAVEFGRTRAFRYNVRHPLKDLSSEGFVLGVESDKEISMTGSTPKTNSSELRSLSGRLTLYNQG